MGGWQAGHALHPQKVDTAIARGYIAREMDWITLAASLAVATLGGGVVFAVVSFFVSRHQAQRDERMRKLLDLT